MFKKSEYIKTDNRLYWVTAPLVDGATPSLFLAYEERRQQWVVIKGVAQFDQPDDPELQMRKRELSEMAAEITAQTPNVQPILDVFEHLGEGDQRIRLGMVCPVLQGESLATILAQRKPVQLVEALCWLELALQALGFLHDQEYIYGMLQPDQLLVGRGGAALTLMDLSTARNSREYRKQYLQSPPVPSPYLAPEQQEGKIFRQSDFFALGVIFYTMLAGFLPPPVHERLQRGKALVMVPEELKLPGSVQNLVNQLLELQPMQRPADVVQARRQIDAIRAEMAQRASRSRSLRTKKWLRQQPQTAVVPVAAPTAIIHAPLANVFSELFVMLACACLAIAILFNKIVVLVLPPLVLIGHLIFEAKRKRIPLVGRKWRFEGTLYLLTLYALPALALILLPLSAARAERTLILDLSALALILVWAGALVLAGMMSEEVSKL